MLDPNETLERKRISRSESGTHFDILGSTWWGIHMAPLVLQGSADSPAVDVVDWRGGRQPVGAPRRFCTLQVLCSPTRACSVAICFRGVGKVLYLERASYHELAQPHVRFRRRLLSRTCENVWHITCLFVLGSLKHP